MSRTILAALARCHLDHPGGADVTWDRLSSSASGLLPAEHDVAARLVAQAP